MKKSKYVENYFIEEYECGMFSITFNLTERWLGYHQYSDNQYIFGSDVENETQEEWEVRIQDVEEFLPKGINYLPTVIQNKEQTQWYFIPYELISRDKRIKQKEKDGNKIH